MCVADLGRCPRHGGELVRIGRDGRIGLRLARPGTGQREDALDYRALGEEQAEAEAREERRLFYVAMTRARERLILSGAASSRPAGGPGRGRSPGWRRRSSRTSRRRRRGPEAGSGSRVRGGPGSPTRSPSGRARGRRVGDGPRARDRAAGRAGPVAEPAGGTGGPGGAAPVSTAQLLVPGRVRAVRLPLLRRARAAAPADRARGPGAAAIRGTRGARRARRARPRAAGATRLQPPDPADAGNGRGRGGCRPVAGARPRSRSCSTLSTPSRRARSAPAWPARATCGVRSDSPSLHDGVLITGSLDVARPRAPTGAMLIVDYKSDRLEGADPAAIVARDYASQRLIYALAALEPAPRRWRSTTASWRPRAAGDRAL